MVNYTKCPICGHKLPAHKGHTRTFAQLSEREKINSVKAMTLNLKRAIQRTPNSERRLLWAINHLSKA